jgi:putative ABC transport system permease protein
MAWRDSRRHRSRLVLFSCSIVLGIAAMVAIGSFGRNLSVALEQQSKSLLGADLQIRARQAFTAHERELLEGYGEERSFQVSFASMIVFPSADATRLVQVRVIEGGFPYYGSIESSPANGVAEYRNGTGLLVEENLLLQFGVKVGDTAKLGSVTVPIVGALRQVPGENIAFGTIAPRVYLPARFLETSGLIGAKSIVRHACFFRFNTTEQFEAARTELNEARAAHHWDLDDVDERKQELGDALANLQRFLNLAGFIALLLGAIGIASAIQTHIQRRLDSVAILRCLGARVSQTVTIYLIQAAALGLIGVAAGVALGIFTMRQLPALISEFIPLDTRTEVYWGPIAKAALVGFGISLLFALLPLLRVRLVSPLMVLRRATAPTPRTDHWTRLIYAAIGLAVTLFAISQSEQWRHGVGFAVGLGTTLLVLGAVAQGIHWITRRITRPHWPYVVRQGIASLYRPNNRTQMLMVSIGLGVFMILTLYLTQNGLVRQLFPDSSTQQANAILFDVQADQAADLAELLAGGGFPVFADSPVVTMRIQSIKGRTIQEIQNDRKSDTRRWALQREYRSSYRETLSDAETLISGEWIARASFDDPWVPVSLEDSIAQGLQVDLGDEIVFDVQGIPLRTRVTSLRKVDWRRVQANFFALFPAGVLEDAPGFHILTTRVTDAAASARLQRLVSDRFPNVSTIDLILAMEVIQSIVDKVSLGIRFMAWFTALTGGMLLVTATLNSRYQRFQEAVLLRTLGASRSQILKIQFVEYALLGTLASLTGIALSIAAAWALSHFVFKVGFEFPFSHVAAALLINSTITVAVGALSSLGVTRQPPLKLLRTE